MWTNRTNACQNTGIEDHQVCVQNVQSDGKEKTYSKKTSGAFHFFSPSSFFIHLSFHTLHLHETKSSLSARSPSGATPLPVYMLFGVSLKVTWLGKFISDYNAHKYNFSYRDKWKWNKTARVCSVLSYCVKGEEQYFLFLALVSTHRSIVVALNNNTTSLSGAFCSVRMNETKRNEKKIYKRWKSLMRRSTRVCCIYFFSSRLTDSGRERRRKNRERKKRCKEMREII